MKNLPLLIIGVLLFNLNLDAKQVDTTAAKEFAKKFILSKLQSEKIKQVSDLTCAYIAHSNDSSNNYLLIYNINLTDGYIIVAADDRVVPILGYSDQGAFDEAYLQSNQALAKWLQSYTDQIRIAIQLNIEPTDEIRRLWTDLEVTGQYIQDRAANAVNPLVQTRWDQSPYYNSQCPFDQAANQRAVTGCVATAMAQIMKYWNYPVTGSGIYSYNSANYGTLSANFGATTYQWASMPNTVTSTNNAVATLMYHCGVSVDMNYGVSGSSAQTLDVTNALKTYFNYSTSVTGLARSNFGDAQWLQKMKDELNAGRPIQYAATGSGGGHSFVCDGYDANDFLHFNWGWSGQADGYFYMSLLNPGSIGTGGGTGGFNTNHRAIVGIQPPSNVSTASLEMFSTITVNPNPISFINSFTVNANVKNVGSSTFSGEYCAALFTSNWDFVDYIEVLTNINPLPAGYNFSGGLTFSNSGMVVVPGSYKIAFYSRPVGGQWKIIGSGSYSNYTTVNISQPVNNVINLYSNIVYSTNFRNGSPVTVTANLKNISNTTYFGEYSAALIDFNNQIVQTLGTYNESSGLPANYSYSQPYIQFNCASVNVTPGTYMLAILQKQSGTNNLYYVGGSTFGNPAIVNVSAAPIQPDVYEQNNTWGQAYNLSLSFSGNTATRSTPGSNCHLSTDIDHYKLTFPQGYTYTTSARVHDSYNSGNGQSYTLDAIASYSMNGTTWSDGYDDVFPDDIHTVGGNTLYFKVLPFFAGQSGTYMLDLNVSRTAISTDIQEDLGPQSKLYPNPASNEVFLQTESSGAITIYNAMGQQVLTDTILKGKNSLNLGSLAKGMYLVKITCVGKESFQRLCLQ